MVRWRRPTGLFCGRLVLLSVVAYQRTAVVPVKP